MVMLGSTVICSAIAMMKHPRNQARPLQVEIGEAISHFNKTLARRHLKTPPSWSHEQCGVQPQTLKWSAKQLQQSFRSMAWHETWCGKFPRVNWGTEYGKVTSMCQVWCCFVGRLRNGLRPLESEIQTRTMSEMMNFQRLPSEVSIQAWRDLKNIFHIFI